MTAFYEHPDVERNVIVQAESPQQAMVKALLERKVPACFSRDEYGWLLPVYWSAGMGGRHRWPRVAQRNRLTWGDEGDPHSLRFAVEEA